MRILRQPEVSELTGLSRTSLWRRTKDGSFPRPFRLGGKRSKAVGWKAEEVEEWLESLERV